MCTVTFHTPTEIDNSLLKYAVIVAMYRGKWIFCRHKARDTWELPGGHREVGESIKETASRELYEETGALQANIQPVAVYCVTMHEKNTYGMLFFSDTQTIDELPRDSEIGEVILLETIPQTLTYPDIQPALFGYIEKWLATKKVNANDK